MVYLNEIQREVSVVLVGPEGNGQHRVFLFLIPVFWLHFSRNISDANLFNEYPKIRSVIRLIRSKFIAVYLLIYSGKALSSNTLKCSISIG